jgi:lambda repressor-like predicted transcriptional regulator
MLGTIAAESYSEYLLREKNPPQRETIIRQRLEVSPWRIW